MLPTSAARPVLISGPTASGKSALALAIAERDGGWVINADASQVYACWRVLTARPDDGDLARAPHRLYGHVGCATRYSTGSWLGDAAAVIAEARRARARPVIVGGTGLYFIALTEGLAAIPEIPPEVRARSEAALAAGRIAALLDDLARGDPESLARIDRANPMRVQRAWDVLMATGRGLSDWHRETPTPVVAPDDAVRIVVEPDSDGFEYNIRQRFEKMVEIGALEECRRVMGLELDPALPAARVIGAEALMAHLRGETTLAAAVDAGAAATRQFAKRQRTWMRNRMAEWMRIAPDADLALVPRA